MIVATNLYLLEACTSVKLLEDEPLIYLGLVTATLHQVNVAGNSIK